MNPQAHPQSQTPPPWPYSPRGPGAPPTNQGSIAVEAICAFFGLYGVGWLMRGRTGIGVTLMLGGLLWAALVIVVSIFTAGLGLCCLGPAHLALVAGDAATLANQP